jgi:hypothetical protein
MAIFGDLADLPFPEIFNMVGRRTGRLLIFGVPDQGGFELDLIDGTLRGLQIDGEAISDPLRARDRLAVLMEAPRGLFEFHRSLPEQLRGNLELPVTSLLMAVASAVDEISAYRDRFPHPQTRFKRMASEEVWLDDDLYLFSERATPYLLRGTDADELARELGVSLEQVQLYLYKLRSVGWVAPVRAFEDISFEMPFPESMRPTAEEIDDLFAGAMSPPVPPASSAASPALAAVAAPPSQGWGKALLSRLAKNLRDRLEAAWTH